MTRPSRDTGTVIFSSTGVPIEPGATTWLLLEGGGALLPPEDDDPIYQSLSIRLALRKGKVLLH
jgi:hypothetical protein